MFSFIGFGRRGFVRRPQSTVFVAPGNPADDSHYFNAATAMVLQPGMVVCETHSATAFGVPFMFLAQAAAGFTSFDWPATVTI
jgi:hypothetical protein